VIIPLKTKQDIQLIKEGGQKLGVVLSQLIDMAEPGVNLLEIEKRAVQLIKEGGGEPGFARVPGYKWATCLNINEGIVHGIPKDYRLKNGDLLSIDIGNYYQGWNTDMCATILVESPNSKLQITNKKEMTEFLETGKRALEKAIEQARPGNRVGHMSQKIQEIIERQGYSCATNLTGHGVGKKLHESPVIPCLLRGRIEDTPLLKKGMVIAIEVIYTQGSPELVVDSDDHWTMKTKDGQPAALFEKTIAITQSGPEIITPFY